MNAQTMATPARPWWTARGTRAFYPTVAAAALLLVFAGFASRYYLMAFTGAPSVRPLVHVHAVAFSAWLVLFLAQSLLVAAGRRDLHRRVGVAGAALAAVMLFLGVATAIEGARRGRMPGGPFPDALAFLLVPLGDILLFAGFAAAALHHRRRPELHRRLMLLATIGGLLWPAIVRIPHVAGRLPLMLGLLAAFVLASPLRDLAARRRVHPVDVWGGLLVLASVPLRTALARTQAWHDVAAWLVR